MNEFDVIFRKKTPYITNGILRTFIFLVIVELFFFAPLSSFDNHPHEMSILYSMTYFSNNSFTKIAFVDIPFSMFILFFTYKISFTKKNGILIFETEQLKIVSDSLSINIKYKDILEMNYYDGNQFLSSKIEKFIKIEYKDSIFSRHKLFLKNYQLADELEKTILSFKDAGFYIHDYN